MSLIFLFSHSITRYYFHSNFYSAWQLQCLNKSLIIYQGSLKNNPYVQRLKRYSSIISQQVTRKHTYTYSTHTLATPSWHALATLPHISASDCTSTVKHTSGNCGKKWTFKTMAGDFRFLLRLKKTETFSCWNKALLMIKGKLLYFQVTNRQQQKFLLPSFKNCQRMSQNKTSNPREKEVSRQSSDAFFF